MYLDFLEEKEMLRSLNPLEKFIISMGTIIVLISLKNIYLNIFVITIGGIILALQNLSLKRVLFFFIPPFMFLIPTLLAQGIQFSPELTFRFEWEIFFRVIGALIAIGYFILTCKFKDLYYVGIQLKIPKLICELGVLMFNYLNIMYISYVKIKMAMEARGAFCSFKTVYRDVGFMFTKVFLNSYYSLKGQSDAMRSRGYDEELIFFPKRYKLSRKVIMSFSLWIVLLIVIDRVSL